VLDKFGKSPINDAAENQQIEVRTIFACTELKQLFALILINCFFFSALTSLFNTAPPPTVLKLGTSQQDAVAARASRRIR
jgi:hypothetical protein